MSNKTIKIGQLDMELQSIFSTFEHHVHTAVDTAAENTAKEAVKKLKRHLPTTSVQKGKSTKMDGSTRKHRKE